MANNETVTDRKRNAPAAVDEKVVAVQLSVAVSTLRAWRRRGRGPRFVRFGRAVRYRTSDIEEYLENPAG